MVGATVGTLAAPAVITATLAAGGLSAAGPVAGGIFATAQGWGWVTAGSFLAGAQSLAMGGAGGAVIATGITTTVAATGAAVGGTAINRMEQRYGNNNPDERTNNNVTPDERSENGHNHSIGNIMFVGVWTNTYNSIPIRMKLNTYNRNQIETGVNQFINELRSSNSRSGIIAFQS